MSDVLELLGNILVGVITDEKPKQRWKRWVKRGVVVVVAALVLLLVWREYF
jgi:hypothetical protein